MKKESKKLNLPVFKDPLPPPPSIPMDAYADFVEWGLKEIVHPQAIAVREKEAPKGLPFRLKS